MDHINSKYCNCVGCRCRLEGIKILELQMARQFFYASFTKGLHQTATELREWLENNGK